MIAVGTTIGAGLVGGVYAAFSLMVMPAFGRLGGRDATAAMIAVNRAAERGPFLAVFGATTLGAVALATQAAHRGSGAHLAVAAACLASSAVTVAVNVPLNRRLERDGASFWPTYRTRWAAANTVRAGLALTALVVGIAHRAGAFTSG